MSLPGFRRLATFGEEVGQHGQAHPLKRQSSMAVATSPGHADQRLVDRHQAKISCSRPGTLRERRARSGHVTQPCEIDPTVRPQAPALLRRRHVQAQGDHHLAGELDWNRRRGRRLAERHFRYHPGHHRPGNPSRQSLMNLGGLRAPSPRAALCTARPQPVPGSFSRAVSR
jgi:hypothetical protein